MRVRTLREHGNAYGPVRTTAGGRAMRHGKRLGDTYEHPAPRHLIDEGIVEAVRRGRPRAVRAS